MNFRFVFLPAFEVEPSCVFVGTPCITAKKAREQADIVADYTLLLHKFGLMNDYSNYSVIEKLVDGEWIEVEDFDEDGMQ